MSIIPVPESMLGGGIGIRVLGAGAVCDGYAGWNGVDSTRSGGVEVVDAGRCVGTGCARMGGDCST